MRRKWAVSMLAVGLVASIALTGCNPAQETKATKDEGKIQVYTSLFPLQDFAKKIGGNHVQVTNVVPPGVEPHDFELSAKDMANLSEADVLVYNGAGFEAWVEKASKSLDQDQTLIVNTTEKLKLLKAEEHGHEHEGEGDHGKEEHEHGEFDPHVWLDPTIAKQQALRIRDALIQKDPTNKADYEKNYKELATKLDQLDQEYKEMVQKAKKKEFITSHAAFAYLAHRYGLEQIAVSGISPSDEPSAKELEGIIEKVKEHQIRYIFFETLVSGKVAEVVKNEVKAEALVLNPLEGLTKEEAAQGADYFSIMRKNKENLAKALEATP